MTPSKPVLRMRPLGATTRRWQMIIATENGSSRCPPRLPLPHDHHIPFAHPDVLVVEDEAVPEDVE
ncbi:hypothetical protein, partial [Brevibacterium casei]|uniref:hypothetical protein n=1 Tax=Brevibacterium casei TaxID=33889 RepID=UPI001643DD31